MFVNLTLVHFSLHKRMALEQFADRGQCSTILWLYRCDSQRVTYDDNCQQSLYVTNLYWSTKSINSSNLAYGCCNRS